MRVRTQLMNRWIYGTTAGEPVLRPQIGEIDNQRVVSFLDLVQALAIRAIRVQFNIPLAKIREAYETARNQYGVEYPFAVSHKTYLFGNVADPKSCDVIIDLTGKGTNDRLVQLTGKRKKNQVIREVLETYHRDLDFRNDGLATSYRAFVDRDAFVVMNPEVNFGEPVVGETGYTAQTLYSSFKSEGSVRGLQRPMELVSRTSSLHANILTT